MTDNCVLFSKPINAQTPFIYPYSNGLDGTQYKNPPPPPPPSSFKNPPPPPLHSLKRPRLCPTFSLNSNLPYLLVYRIDHELIGSKDLLWGSFNALGFLQCFGAPSMSIQEILMCLSMSCTCVFSD